jgi:citrate synthase
MTFQESILQMVPDQLKKKRELIAQRGKDIVAQVTLRQTLEGLPEANVLTSEIPAPAHGVDPQLGLIVSGQRMATFVGESFVNNYIRILSGQPFLDGVEHATSHVVPTKLSDYASDVEAALLIGYKHFFGCPNGMQRLNALLSVHCEAGSHPLSAVQAIVLAESHKSKVAVRLLADETSELTHAEYLDDLLYLQGMLGAIVPAVYRKLYLNAEPIISEAIGYTQRLAESFGNCDSPEKLVQNTRMFDLLLYLMAYHAQGNVSTQTSVNAASSLVDPWSVFSAMATGLKGLNHGGAAQMGAFQLFSLIDKAGINASVEELTKIAENRIIVDGDPGWCAGHRTLRADDPRRDAQAKAIEREYPGSSMYQLAYRWYKQALVPVIKANTGAKFAEENVDSLTVVSAYEMGLVTSIEQSPFLVCIFAMARWAGVSSEIFWKTCNDRKVGNGRALAVKPALFRPEDNRSIRI